MTAATRRRPLIRFEIPDTELVVRCAKGHNTFRLEVRVRMAGSLVTRHAVCLTCGESQPLDDES